MTITDYNYLIDSDSLNSNLKLHFAEDWVNSFGLISKEFVNSLNDNYLTVSVVSNPKERNKRKKRKNSPREPN